MKWLLLATAILAPLSGNAEPLRVFVSIPPQKTLVEKVGGEHVEVQVMVQPGHGPGTYDPTPRQIAALAKASLYVRIGVPFERVWMDPIRDANPNMMVIDAREGIDLRRFEPEEQGENGHHHAERPGASHQEESGRDPHLWTNPILAKRMTGTIRDALVELDPRNGPDYARNQEAFAAELDALDRDIRELLRDIPQRRFMVYHPSWGYFADTYGLTQLAIEMDGKEPGARSLGALIEQAKRERIKVIFVQPQLDDRPAEQVARAIGGRVVAIDPLAADYVGNLREVARQISEAARE